MNIRDMKIQTTLREVSKQHLMISLKIYRMHFTWLRNLGGIESLSIKPVNILLMEEILHHLGCIKPCKWWDKLPINWCRISAINSITLKRPADQNIKLGAQLMRWPSALDNETSPVVQVTVTMLLPTSVIVSIVGAPAGCKHLSPSRDYRDGSDWGWCTFRGSKIWGMQSRSWGGFQDRFPVTNSPFVTEFSMTFPRHHVLYIAWVPHRNVVYRIDM